ncbi:sigma-70 family RNA polymerase sigma factor [Phytoactinopolyspora mesophila]|uniref:sigma-70 family RNA polymerase sigma factor n=1 Tax=Phytoactinopolyspora mesophila TaxID=2650750 RepID=UPI001391B918
MIQWGDTDEPTALLTKARTGDDAAFEVLYESVAQNARRAAHRIVRDAYAADDLVQEAFYHILRAVRSGHGPTDSFSAYVMATVKRLAYRYSKTQSQTMCSDDNTLWERLIAPVAFESPQADVVAAAWETLPKRWQQVLWLIEVDRYSPAELAPRMSMTANAVSSLATRARSALRSAYLAQLQEA